MVRYLEDFIVIVYMRLLRRSWHMKEKILQLLFAQWLMDLANRREATVV